MTARRRYRFFHHLATDHGSVRRAFPRTSLARSRRRSPTARSSPRTGAVRRRTGAAARSRPARRRAARARARGVRLPANLGHRGELRRPRLPAARRPRRRDRRGSRHPRARRHRGVGGRLRNDGSGVSRRPLHRRRRGGNRARSTRSWRDTIRARRAGWRGRRRAFQPAGRPLGAGRTGFAHATGRGDTAAASIRVAAVTGLRSRCRGVRIGCDQMQLVAPRLVAVDGAASPAPSCRRRRSRRARWPCRR